MIFHSYVNIYQREISLQSAQIVPDFAKRASSILRHLGDGYPQAIPCSLPILGTLQNAIEYRSLEMVTLCEKHNIVYICIHMYYLSNLYIYIHKHQRPLKCYTTLHQGFSQVWHIASPCRALMICQVLSQRPAQSLSFLLEFFVLCGWGCIVKLTLCM